MLLQCQILVSNDAEVSHNEVHAFGSEPYTLFWLVLRAVFYSVFPVMSMFAGLPYMGMPAHAHSGLPAPSPALLRHCCALFSASWITVSTLFEMASIRARRYGKNTIPRFFHGRITISIVSGFFSFSCWLRVFYKSRHIQGHSFAYQHMVSLYLVPGSPKWFHFYLWIIKL